MICAKKWALLATYFGEYLCWNSLSLLTLSMRQIEVPDWQYIALLCAWKDEIYLCIFQILISMHCQCLIIDKKNICIPFRFKQQLCCAAPFVQRLFIEIQLDRFAPVWTIQHLLSTHFHCLQFVERIASLDTNIVSTYNWLSLVVCGKGRSISTHRHF